MMSDADANSNRSQMQALDMLRGLRNRIVHVAISDPDDPTSALYAEFDLAISERFISVLAVALSSAAEPEGKLTELSTELQKRPNARLAAALVEAETLKPNYKTVQGLFDALETERQG